MLRRLRFLWIVREGHVTGPGPSRVRRGRGTVSGVLIVAATERELALLDGLDTFCCGIGPVEAPVIP